MLERHFKLSFETVMYQENVIDVICSIQYIHPSTKCDLAAVTHLGNRLRPSGLILVLNFYSIPSYTNCNMIVWKSQICLSIGRVLAERQMLLERYRQKVKFLCKDTFWLTRSNSKISVIITLQTALAIRQ